MCSGTETGSYLRLIDSCITQIKSQGSSRTCNESKEDEEEDIHLKRANGDGHDDPRAFAKPRGGVSVQEEPRLIVALAFSSFMIGYLLFMIGVLVLFPWRCFPVGRASPVFRVCWGVNLCLGLVGCDV